MGDTAIKVLDHGYLKLVEAWGSDERIIEAARMSTAKGFLSWLPEWECNACGGRWYGYQCEANTDGKPVCNRKESNCTNSLMKLNHPGDEKLLRYLWGHKHTTPFEMAGMTIEAQAPIFVFREWHRHRTQSYNEMSARYVPLPDVNYIPSVERLMLNSKTNKQAGTIKGAEELTEENARFFQMQLADMYKSQEGLYQMALKAGVPKELARVHLPVGRYSRMRASANLLNWLKFLTLRMAHDAQYEIRMYANAVGDLIAQHFPHIWALFTERK